MPLCGPHMIIAFAIHFPSLLVVFEVDVQAFGKHPLFQLRFQDRKTYLYTAKKISIHPIGAGKIDNVLSATPEIENPAVLKKTSYYRSHPNLLGQSRNSR